MKRLLIVTSLLVSMLSKAHAFDYESYTPSNIDSVVMETKNNLSKIRVKTESDTGKKVPTLEQPATYKYKFAVLYAGKIRQVSGRNLEGLRFFERSFSNEPRLTTMATKEILVKSTDRKYQYWIPMRDDLMPTFKEEIIAGEEFDIYVLNPYNVVRENGRSNSVFFINDFQKRVITNSQN